MYFGCIFDPVNLGDPGVEGYAIHFLILYVHVFEVIWGLLYGIVYVR